MNTKNYDRRISSLLTMIYVGEADRGEIYDGVVEIIEFISRILLKVPGVEIAHLATLHGLQDEIAEGLPTDSKRLADYHFANNVIQQMFTAKEMQREENSRRVEEIVDEWSKEGKIERLH